MFTYVSGANFFGEIVEWTGFALACWSLPSLAFVSFTALNIGPRAIQHHKYVYGDWQFYLYYIFSNNNILLYLKKIITTLKIHVFEMHSLYS